MEDEQLLIIRKDGESAFAGGTDDHKLMASVRFSHSVMSDSL